MEIRIEGLTGAITYVDKIDRGLAHLEPLMRRIAAVLEDNVRDRFDQQIDPNGVDWRPWAPSTAAQREKEGITTILRYTGDMLASLSATNTSDSVTLAIGTDYAEIHEFGAGKVPRRAMLGFGGHLGGLDSESVTDEIEKYLNDIIG